jgi:hypothetical protein
MKKTSARNRPKSKASNYPGDEYRFDYSKANPNRFAGSERGKGVVVLLAPDVAKVFKDGASVNEALRAIMKLVPRRRTAHSSN